MITEQWTRWEPIQGLAARYYIESISDSIEGFKIVLSDVHDENKRVQVVFENSVNAYRSTEEILTLSTMYAIDEKYGKHFSSGWTFFKLVNSTYTQWLSEQTYGITDSLFLIHFSFYAIDSMVDVIATYEPKVEFIENKPEAV